jgi:hypothetical protein
LNRRTVMKQTALLTALALTLTLAAPAWTGAAPTKATTLSGLAIPVTGTGGGTFTGTFTLQRFVADATSVSAVGLLVGTVTDAGGVATSVVQNVSMPVTVNQPDATSGAAAPAAITAAQVCPILHLDLGPLHLDLLGLKIDLSRVILDITAEQGAGNLLGNLLCAITGLLDSPSGVANALNQILAALLG